MENKIASSYQAENYPIFVLPETYFAHISDQLGEFCAKILKNTVRNEGIEAFFLKFAPLSVIHLIIFCCLDK